MAILNKSFGAASNPGNMPDKVNIHNQSQKNPQEQKSKHGVTFKSNFTPTGTAHQWVPHGKDPVQEKTDKPWAPAQDRHGFFKKPDGK
jgi:hypothetical protein